MAFSHSSVSTLLGSISRTSSAIACRYVSFSCDAASAALSRHVLIAAHRGAPLAVRSMRSCAPRKPSQSRYAGSMVLVYSVLNSVSSAVQRSVVNRVTGTPLGRVSGTEAVDSRVDGSGRFRDPSNLKRRRTTSPVPASASGSFVERLRISRHEGAIFAAL